MLNRGSFNSVAQHIGHKLEDETIKSSMEQAQYTLHSYMHLFNLTFGVNDFSLCCVAMVTDESMELLYAEGKGVVFEQVLRWVQSPKEHLRSSGVLAIGNFARNGESRLTGRTFVASLASGPHVCGLTGHRVTYLWPHWPHLYGLTGHRAICLWLCWPSCVYICMYFYIYIAFKNYICMHTFLKEIKKIQTNVENY